MSDTKPMPTEPLRLNGHFLVAMPNLSDASFAQSVTYVCEHNEEGALGVIINRPSDINLGDMFEQLNVEPSDADLNNGVVFHGGPVNPERGFVLHKQPGEWDASLSVADDMVLTSSRDVLEAIAAGTGPAEFLVALGYAGWTPGQLEQELANNAWLTAPGNTQIIFDVPVAQRWEAAMAVLGIASDRLSHQAGHA